MRSVCLLFALWLTGCSRPPLERVRTASMYPSLGPWSQCRIAREPFEAERGHVVLVALEGQVVVRRVVGLPGDHIAFESGALHINGEPVLESVERARVACAAGVSIRCRCRITRERHGQRVARVQRLLREGAGEDFRCDRGAEPENQRVPVGHFYVLADNRDGAVDSRTLGAVPRLLGRLLSCR